MLKYFQNRELSHRLGIPLNRWKRWSREFLPPDPLGGLQSGYARQYSLKDAFRVYFAGYLVSGLGYSIPEARRILKDLNGWLKKNIIDHFDSFGNFECDSAPSTFRCDLMIMPVESSSTPAFGYHVRSLVERKALGGDDSTLWQEQFFEQVIKPGKPLESNGYPPCARWVDMSALARQFFICLQVKEYSK